MLQKLIYSIFVFLSSEFSNFYVFIFRIIFERTCYGTTVFNLNHYVLNLQENLLLLYWDKAGFYTKEIALLYIGQPSSYHTKREEKVVTSNNLFEAIAS